VDHDGCDRRKGVVVAESVELADFLMGFSWAFLKEKKVLKAYRDCYGIVLVDDWDYTHL